MIDQEAQAVVSSPEKPLVLASAQVMARFRRWFLCPPLCQRAGLVLTQLCVPAPRNVLTLPDSSDETSVLAPDTGAHISDKDLISTPPQRQQTEHVNLKVFITTTLEGIMATEENTHGGHTTVCHDDLRKVCRPVWDFSYPRTYQAPEISHASFHTTPS